MQNISLAVDLMLILIDCYQSISAICLRLDVCVQM